MVVSVEERVSGGADCEVTAARIHQNIQLKHRETHTVPLRAHAINDSRNVSVPVFLGHCTAMRSLAHHPVSRCVSGLQRTIAPWPCVFVKGYLRMRCIIVQPLSARLPDRAERDTRERRDGAARHLWDSWDVIVHSEIIKIRQLPCPQ